MAKLDGHNQFKLNTPDNLWDVFMYKLNKDKKTAKDAINGFIHNDVKTFADKMGINLEAPIVATGTKKGKKANNAPKKKDKQIDAFPKNQKRKRTPKTKTKN